MNKKWLVFTALLVSTITATTNYNYTLSNLSIALPVQTFIGASSHNTVQVQFSFVSADQVCSALMVVQKSAVRPSLRDFDFTNASPTQSTTYDLQNANIGATQTVQLTGLIPGSSYYIFIFNFEYGVKFFTYTITIAQITGISSFCYGSNVPSIQNIYCSSCASSSNYGAYCTLNDTYILSNGNSQAILMLGNSYNHVTIPSTTSQITVTYSTTGSNVQIFVQFQDHSTDIAGYFNYANSGRFSIYYANYQYTLQISSGGSAVSIGIKNKVNQPYIFNIGYSIPSSSSNVLAIVLGVLGGLLLIALIVAAFFVIRRVRSSDQQQIHPRASSIQVVVQQNALSNQQIQTFFPNVLCRTIFQQQEASINQLRMEQKTTEDRDCVICLCPVGLNDMMRMTYCRHVFHGSCLGEWFKKQRNCPYCRESYNRNQTMEHYQTVLKNSGRNFLSGAGLVHQIWRTKPFKSKIQIEDIKE